MKIVMTLVERKETIFNGAAQVKLVFADRVLPKKEQPKITNKLVLYLSPDEADDNGLLAVDAGEKVELQLSVDSG